MKALKYVRAFCRDEEGLEPVEYALMLCLLALVAVVGALTLGESVSAKFGAVAGAVDATPLPE